MVDALSLFPNLLLGFMILLTLVLLPFINEDHSPYEYEDDPHAEERRMREQR